MNDRPVDETPAHNPPRIPLLPGERLDDLWHGGLRIIQNPAFFRFTTDAYLLAAFAQPRPGQTVLELGSGGGVVLLLLGARTQAASLVGLEIQEELADLAARNVRLNALDDRVRIIRHDLRNGCPLEPARFDLIVSNPPYIPLSSGRPSPCTPLALSKHELTCSLDDVAQAAARWIKGRGRFVLVHRPARLPDVINALEAMRLQPKEIVFVHDRPGKEASTLLVEARSGARPGLAVGPPLFVKDKKGAFTPEMEEVFAGRWPLKR